MLRSRPKSVFLLITLLLLPALPAHADMCLQPIRPYAPHDPATAREYADLIREDFETYLSDIQVYFRCLDLERARAFREAQEVTQEYGQFIRAER
jgi:hypothetical protein